jgi:amidase
MTESWQKVSEGYRKRAEAKIPREWKLSTTISKSISSTSSQSVLDIPRTCGLLTEQELDIAETHNAVALLEKLRNGILTPSEVTLAFCKRAAIAQQLVCTSRFYT